ncbi:MULTISPECIES: endonuclease domain-containing protein [unclassified Modestobacter]
MCAVCREAPAVHVDHDHVTGAVRDLLCFNCNGGLGQFRDDEQLLRAAADYVERHRIEQGRDPDGAGRHEVRPAIARASGARRVVSPGMARWLAMQSAAEQSVTKPATSPAE